MSKRNSKKQEKEEKDKKNSPEKKEKVQKLILDDLVPLRRSMRNIGKPKVEYADKPIGKNEFIIQLSESSEESEQSDQNMDNSDQNAQVVGPKSESKQKKERVRKVKVKTQVLRKRKFKIGKWNPDVEILKYEYYKNKPGQNLLGLEDSVQMANLNLFRAVNTNDIKLLSKVFYEKKLISSLNISWSADFKETPIDLIIKNKQISMLDTLLFPKFDDLDFDQDYEKLRNSYFCERTEPSLEFIERVDTGSVSRNAYGYHVRPVEMTRGNKQGNNAFAAKPIENTKNLLQYVQSEQFAIKLLSQRDTTPQNLLDIHRKNIQGFNLNCVKNLHFAINSGNIELSAFLIQYAQKLGKLPKNKMTIDIFTNPKKISDEELKKHCMDEITNKILLIHVAALDPTGITLKRIIDLHTNEITKACSIQLDKTENKYDFPSLQSKQVNLITSDGYTLLHFASICQTTKNLEILMDMKFDFKRIEDSCHQKSALELAICFDLEDNVKFLIQQDKSFFLEKKYNHLQKITPIGIACTHGSINSLKMLVNEFNANQTRQLGFDKLTPLALASINDKFDCVEFLCDHKGRVNCKDKFERTPLILAIKNGHSKIASLLLQRGASWEQADSSMNTPIHYAAGFGWIDCLELLIKVGANINSQNAWKTTPIQVAALKNRKACFQLLLNQDGIDVNGKDQQGRTLLQMMLIKIDEQTPKFIEKILELGGDPNIQDLQGDATLHHLASYFERNKQSFEKDNDIFIRENINDLDQSKESSSSYHENGEDEQMEDVLDNVSFNDEKNQIVQNSVNQVKVQTNEQKIKLELQISKIGEMILRKGGDLNTLNKSDLSPFQIAFNSKQILLLKQFLPYLNILTCKDILFNFRGMLILDEFYIDYLISILSKHDLISYDQILNKIDKNGYTSFLYLFKDYSELYKVVLNKVQEEILKFPGILNNEIQADQFQYLESNFAIMKLFQKNNPNPIQNVDQKKKNQALIIAKNICERNIQTKFLQLVQIYIEKGANPFVYVQKIQKEQKVEDPLEIEKQKLYHQQYEFDFDDESTDPDEIDEEVKKLLKRQKRRENKEKKNLENLKEKEKKEYTLDGLKNCWHFYADQPAICFDENMFLEIMQWGVDVNKKDINGDTPVFIQISQQMPIQDLKQCREQFFKKLIDFGLKIDEIDDNLDTAFLQLFSKQDYENAKLLLSKGANINHQNKEKESALFYQFKKQEIKRLQYFLNLNNENSPIKLSEKIDINLKDKKGRNLMHLAMNKSLASIDATFEFQQLLIDHGIDYNMVDKKGRVPLHYAFIKFGEKPNQSQLERDPIEIISNVLSLKDIEINVQDKWGKSPLHYAFQIGSILSASYMVQRGAKMDVCDVFGNYPLGTAILYKNWSLATAFIQNNPFQNNLISDEDYERQKRIWKREKREKRKRRQIQLRSSLISSDDDQINSNSIVQRQESESSEEENKDQILEDLKEKKKRSIFKIAIQNQQHSIAYLLLNNYDCAKAIQDAIECKQFNLIKKILQKIPQNQKLDNVINEEGENIFHLFFKNIDFVFFSTDELLDEYIQILINKGIDIYAIDNQNKNILHIICEYKQLRLCKYILLKFPYFRENIQAKDIKNRTIMHTICEQQNFELCKYILEQYSFYDVNAKNSDGLSAFQIYLHLIKDSNLINSEMLSCLIKANGNINELLSLTNYITSQEAKSLYQINQNEFIKEVEDPKTYKSSYKAPLIFYYILQDIFNSQIEQNIRFLAQKGASFENGLDSENRDVFMIAILKNNTKILDLLLDLKKIGGANYSLLDGYQKSAAHYVVNPLVLGSYENDTIIKKLKENKFEMNLPDLDNKTPIDYAIEQKSQKLFKMFTKLKIGVEENYKSAIEESSLVVEVPKNQLQILQFQNQIISKVENEFREEEVQIAQPQINEMEIDNQIVENHDSQIQIQNLDLKIESQKVKDCPIPFELHAQQYIAFNQQKQIKKMNDEDLIKHDQNPQWYLGPQYKVFKDELDELEYSAYMIKSNIEKFFGQYLFYKMQLLYDSNQELYIVLTRWGQIGETGMNQRSPFLKVEDAIAEFKKIFHQKTGSAFSKENVTNFQKKDKRYNLTNLKRFDYDYKELLTNYDWEKVPKSQLPKKIQSLVRSFAHPGYYRESMRDLGVNTSIIPVSGINQESIDKAKTILNKLEIAIGKDHQLSKEGLGGGNYNLKLKAMEEIYELSNLYYETIPNTNYQNVTPQPIKNLESVKQQFEVLKSLTEIGQMSKIFLGALQQQYLQNPIDYMLQIFQTKFRIIEKKSLEYKILDQYISNTWQHTKNVFIANIFSVDKKGEEEKLKSYKDLSNQKLLFHGSSIQNFVGLFYQGMQIVHSNSRGVGSLGQGLYFADQFDKAYQFAGSSVFDSPNCKNASKLILICEVALGNQKYINSHQRIEHLAAGYSSVKLRSKMEPDLRKTIVLEESGLKIPQGKLMNVIDEYMPDLRHYVYNSQAEYCIYRPEQVKIKYIVQIKKKRDYSSLKKDLLAQIQKDSDFSD